MSGRGLENDPRSRQRRGGRGRGRGSPPPAREAPKQEPKFKGGNPDLPCLNYGASFKENRPIEFLQLFGEHCAIHYKPCIAQAFWTSPPAYGAEEEEPAMPDAIPTTNVGKVILADYTSDRKEWKLEAKKILEHKGQVFALVYGQLSESSRSEIKDHEEWEDSFLNRNLLFLIERIRATHIARQSGNPGQDMERVRSNWANLRMFSHETSFTFRKRVEDYQLERTSVGLPEIPDDELVIGILNRLDMTRYATLVRDYLDNERRGIAELPELPSTLWKEIKDTQVIRFRGTANPHLHGVYLSRADDIPDKNPGRGRGGRGRGGRGRGRGRGRNQYDSPPPATEPTKPSDIVCWTCNKKGHRSTSCPTKGVTFAEPPNETNVFLTTVMNFTPDQDDDRHCDTIETDTLYNSVLLTSTNHKSRRHIVLLDTQSAIHLVSDPHLLFDVQETAQPIIVQGITGDRVTVTSEGMIDKIGITAYHTTDVTANILSYHKLQETHTVTYHEREDTFVAVPFLIGPDLVFTCINGHYTLDMSDVLKVYVTASNIKASKYSKRQLQCARAAYDFIIKMGFISYKAAAEVVQRGSITDLGFTRADLVNAQDIYGTPAAYQLGQGTQKSPRPAVDDPIPIHESVEQELQVDLFYFLGNVFLLSISVLMGLIMITHLGPGIDRIKDKPTNDRQGDGSRAKAGSALVSHITQYHNKGFIIKRVTSDGEGSIKATRDQIEQLGVDLNILGHGSHTPHAESAIRHIKNKARSTLHSLPYVLPSKLCSALISFVVHTTNMVPKVNSPGHLPAHSAFLGRIPNFKRDAPHPFGIAGFLQRAHHPKYNTATPRGDYCIWLGTTHNLSGTHRAFNIDTLREITGDVFRPTVITPAAILRLSTLAGILPPPLPSLPEMTLENPTPPYQLDPDRGVEPDVPNVYDNYEGRTDIVTADDLALKDIVVDEQMGMPAMTPLGEPETATAEGTTTSEDDTPLVLERAQSQALELVNARDSNKYELRKSTLEQHIYSTLSIKAARKIYGKELSDKATRDELITCIQKDVWECLDPTYVTKNAIPSKMFLTPKTLPNGEIDRIKGRIVAGGHRQDKSLYEDKEISSPTVALTSVLTMAALAAKEGKHVMTLDHKAAYLNAAMEGPRVEMLISPEVVEILCDIDTSYRKFIRADNKIAVRLKKALYGCVQSAMLWYNELTSTLESIGFKRNPYDTCSFSRAQGRSFDRILVYVDDLFLTSDSNSRLQTIAETLKSRYDAVTYKTGLQHDFLGIHWDFTVAGQVSLSMDGYINDIIRKYNVTEQCSTPATDRLFRTTEDSPKLTTEKSEMFRSCVMTLYYLAKRTRPEILTAVSYCATRILGATVEDEKKLDRILSYLLFSKSNKMILCIGQNPKLKAFVDASFGLYEDGKSITGVVIMLGDATIYVKSGKQKIVTRSSTESELVGISDALSQVLWTREYLLAAGIEVGPAIVYQDNKSTIFLANKGRSTSERSRHIKIRYFFVSHYISAGEIKLEYLPTEDMVADALTKPLHGTLFKTFADTLTGNNNNYTTDTTPLATK